MLYNSFKETTDGQVVRRDKRRWISLSERVGCDCNSGMQAQGRLDGV